MSKNIILYKFSNREKKLLSILIIVLTAVFCYKIVYELQWPAYKEKQLRLQALQNMLELSAQNPEIWALKAAEAKKGWEATIELKGYTVEGIFGFLSACQPVQQDVIVKSMSVLPQQDRGMFEEMIFEFIVEGSYQGVTSYLEQLEKMQAMTVIDNFSIDISREGRAKAKFILKYFILK